jgi:tetratricopeptide (TPR) repeat protein
MPTVFDTADVNRLGRFVLLDEIGRGGMGRVLRAYDAKLRREIAIKLVHTGDAASAARLVREARAMAKLSHPNVVPVYDVGQHQGAVFIAMGLIEGQTLRAWLEAERRSWREVLAVFLAAGRGLCAAHEAGLVHRDFKPDNVMLGDPGKGRHGTPGRVQVMDFGVARPAPNGVDSTAGSRSSGEDPSGSAFTLGATADEEITRAGMVMGTPKYMAPEQHRGATADARSDQFSFCVALYEALYGARPFVGRTVVHLHQAKARGQLAPLPDDAPKVPSWVRRAVLQGLARQPSARWPSLEALLEALRRGSARSRRWSVAAAVIALGGVASLVAVGNRTTPAPCTGAKQRLAPVWNAVRAAQVQEAMSTTRLAYAPAAWDRTKDRLDAYAADWETSFTAACEATRVRREQSPALLDARMACLEGRRRSLDALVDTLTRADDETVQRAVQAAAGLPPITLCDDPEYVQALVPPPDDPAVVAEVELQRDQLAKATALEAAGRYLEGLELAQAVRRQAGHIDHPPLHAEAAFRMGSLLEHTGEYDGSEASLRDAYFEARRVGMDALAAEASSLLVLVLGQRLARPAEALRWAEHAKAEVARFGTDAMTANLLAKTATVHDAVGDYERALGLLHEAIELDARARPADPSSLAGHHASLGIVYARRGDTAAALEHLQRARDVQLEEHGPEHPALVLTLMNLGNVLVASGDPAAAILQYRRALDIGTAALGAEHPDMALIHNNLGNAYENLDRIGESLQQFERALAIEQMRLGADHPDVGAALNNLAAVHLIQGDIEQGQTLARRALEIGERALGPEHPQLAFPLDNLGRALTARGEHAVAREHYLRALAIREHTYGADHPEVARSLRSLASIHLDANAPHEALPLLLRAHGIMRKSYGADHPEFAAVLTVLGEAFVAVGQPEEALAPLEQAWAIHDGPDKPPIRAAATAFTLARALTAARQDRARARELAALARNGFASPDATAADRAEIGDWLRRHPSVLTR